MEDRTGRLFWVAVWGAAGHRLTLVSTGLTAGAGLLMQSLTLFAIAGAGWLVSFTVNLSRTRVWREAVERLDLEAVELPLESSFQDPVARQFLSRLGATRADRRNVLHDLGPTVAARAKAIMIKSAELERASLTLVRALERVAVHLGGSGRLRAELDRHERARTSGLPLIEREAEWTRRALTERLAAIEQLDRWRTAVTGRLDSILSMLEGVPARLARAEALQATTRTLADEGALESLREELEAVEIAAAAVESGQCDQAGEGQRRWPPVELSS